MKKQFSLVNAILCSTSEFKNLVLRSRNTAIYQGTKERKYAENFPLFLADKEYNGFIIEGAGTSELALSCVPILIPVRCDFCDRSAPGSDRAADRKYDRRPLRRCIQPKSGVVPAGTVQRQIGHEESPLREYGDFPRIWQQCLYRHRRLLLYLDRQ